MATATGQGKPTTLTPSAAQVRQALVDADGQVGTAAEALGLHRNWLRELMRRYHISIVREVRGGEERQP